MKLRCFLFFLVFTPVALLAQQKGSIRGSIRTSDGKPAGYVNVALKGTSKGSSTNAQGEFEIRNVEAGSYTLITSFVGLETKEQQIEVRAGETVQVPEIVLKEDAQQLNEIVITDKGHEKKQSEYVAKISLKNLENPQVYSAVSSELLKEQIVTNFDDALLNVPGIEKRWESTGRGYGDGASYYSLRGFESQPTMVNGLPGLTNGTLDPANIEKIEVIKGPSSTLFGSSLISYGGLVNTVTKKPYYGFGGEATYVAGSFGLNRITADINTPLSKEKEVALRVNTAYHSEGSFQDAGFKKSFFIAPSLSYKVDDRLSFLLSAEFIEAEKTNATQLFLNRFVPLYWKNLEELDYNNELSLTSNDISIRNPRYNVQAFMTYKLSDKWTSQTSISRGSARSDGYYTYLWENTDVTRGEFSLYVSDQNARTLSTDIQQNFMGDFTLGNMRHRVVVGLDYFHRQLTDYSTGDAWVYDVTPQGEINYEDPFTGESVDPRYLSQQLVDDLLTSAARGNSNVKDATYSAYFSDVINITPQLLAMASLRIDHFDTEGDITTDEDDYDQTALSPKFGLLYQVLPDRLSLFANYMNGFKNVAPGRHYTSADPEAEDFYIETFKPEHANQIEFGLKTNLFSDKLISTVSFYNIRVSDKLMTDPENARNSIQGAEIESQGFEIEITANPVPGLNIITGYSYNDAQVLEGGTNTWLEKGKRPGESGAKNLFNAWATYRMTTGTLEGFGIGFGANYASELIVLDSKITGRFVLPAYTVLNSSLFYDHSDFRIAVNVNNLTDKEYYKGYSTIDPQKPRSVSASFTYKF